MSMSEFISMDLGTDLTIAKVSELYKESLRLLTEESGLQLDISNLEFVDTAGVQFLIALSEAAEQSGYPLKTTVPSAALTEAIERLGLQRKLAHFLLEN